MKNATRWVGLAVLVGAIGVSGTASADQILSVSANYDSASSDNTQFVITNTATSAITNLQLSGLGTSGSATGIVGNVALPSLLGGASDTFTFNNQAAAFQFDFDDYYSGEVKYTLIGIYKGQAFSVSFSPSSNDTNKFVEFLGNDQTSAGTDKPVSPTIVAHVNAPAIATPEPSTLVLASTAGLMGVGYGWRRRKAKLIA